MTRKLYQDVAEVIRELKFTKAKRRELAVEMAAVFKRNNPNFDYSKWYAACGLEDLP